MKDFSRRGFLSSTSAIALIGLKTGAAKAIGKPVIADYTAYCNEQISKDPVLSNQGYIYTGHYGLVVRNVNDGLPDQDALKVVPGTLWHQDIWPPNQIYPANTNILHGASSQSGAWKTPTLAVLVEPKTLYNATWTDPAWNKGVFYSHDSNSVDKRAHLKTTDSPGYFNAPYALLKPDGSIDYAKDIYHGAGSYDQGNPYELPPGSGGGAGPHVEHSYNAQGIDQYVNQIGFNRDNTSGLFADKTCQIDYYKSNPATKTNKYDAIAAWEPYIKDLISSNINPKSPNSKYNTKAGQWPAWYMDMAIGWVNNPRPMITLQNALWIYRNMWCGENTKEPPEPNDYHYYWGWNEIPFQKSIINDPKNWLCYVIVLPVSMNEGLTLSECLKNGEVKLALIKQLKYYKCHIDNNFGDGDGSNIVLARQSWDARSSRNISGHHTVWYRHFFKEEIIINDAWKIYTLSINDGNKSQLIKFTSTDPNYCSSK